jgi:hypothetical protein
MDRNVPDDSMSTDPKASTSRSADWDGLVSPWVSPRCWRHAR